MNREPSGDVLERIFDDEPLRDVDLASLRDVFADLHAECANTPAPVPRADLAAILAGDALRVSPASVTTAHRPLRARGLKVVRRRLVAAAVSITAGLTMVSGLAAAQALPAPAQHVVEHALDHVGIHIEGDRPKPARPGGAGPTASRTTTTRSTPPRATPPSAGAGDPDGAWGALTVPPTLPVSPIPVTVPAAGTRTITAPTPSLPIAVPTLPLLAL